MKDLATRDFDADPNRVRNWINSYNFPETMRVEVDDDVPEEIKSLVSSLESQKVSRTNTPIEVIPREPSPAFNIPAPTTPETISSDSLVMDAEKSQTDEQEVAPAGNQLVSFKQGEVIDPRITVALEKIGNLEQEVVNLNSELDKSRKVEMDLKQQLEFLELIKNCPTELKKTFRKELSEASTQLTNRIKGLELKMEELPKEKLGSKAVRMDFASDEAAEWFKAKFKSELVFFESKNKIKTWIQSELNGYQVTIIYLSFTSYDCLYQTGVWNSRSVRRFV